MEPHDEELRERITYSALKILRDVARWVVPRDPEFVYTSLRPSIMYLCMRVCMRACVHACMHVCMCVHWSGDHEFMWLCGTAQSTALSGNEVSP